MTKIEEVSLRSAQKIKRFMEIWESAVRQTHLFLSARDLEELKPEVERSLRQIAQLYVYIGENHIRGFIGVEKGKIEMLFVESATLGKGVGKALLTFALDHLQARFVDVNEQNVQAVGFYMHMGFKIIGRSACDLQGRDFPLLHLALDKQEQSLS